MQHKHSRGRALQKDGDCSIAFMGNNKLMLLNWALVSLFTPSQEMSVPIEGERLRFSLIETLMRLGNCQ